MIGLNVLLITAIAWFLGGMLASPFKATQIRNAFIADVGTESDIMWTPGNVPEGYLLERGKAADEFARVAEQVLGAVDNSAGNMQKALEIARHLATGPGTGDGIRSNTIDTYRAIMTGDQGYCSDFTQVFNAIALAAGIPVREWGVSFEGFSGNGHAFNEVYDFGLDKWVMIDSFFSLYILDTRSNEPLSAVEFRDFLSSGSHTEDIAVIPIVAERFGFPSPPAAIEYYRRGADQFYLWFGNNVFSYDRHAAVQFFGPMSRALEQGAAIVSGVHPEIRIVSTALNKSLIDALLKTRNQFILSVVILIVLSGLLMAQLIALRKMRRVNRQEEDIRHE